MKPSHRLAILAALALLPVIPYALLGYAGQDLPFHVTSWIELRDAHFVPGWSAGANFGLGDPHLLFYPPVSLYLGAFLTLTLPIVLAPAAFIWMAVLLSGLCMYIAAGSFLAESERLRAAVLYMLNPYLITTALVRFSAAELLVQAILPVMLLTFYRGVCEPQAREKNRPTLILAVTLALTWLTDIPAAIVLLYGLFAVTGIASWQNRSFAPMLRFAAAEALSALLADLYLAPVWAEQRWISRGSLVAHDPGQLLLFMPQSSPADSALVIACWFFTIVAALILVVNLRGRVTWRHAEPGISLFTATGIVAVFFQLPFAYALWHYLPELASAQFPFRFLPLVFAPLPLLLLSPAARRSIRPFAYTLLVLAALLPFLGFAAMQTGASSRQLPLAKRVAAWGQQGYKGAPEYLPAGAVAPVTRVQAIAAAAPSSNLQAEQCVTSPASAALTSFNRDGSTLATSCGTIVQEHLPVFYYPGWQVSDEGGHPIVINRGTGGLLWIDVPVGTHILTLTFSSVTKLRKASAAVSAATLLFVAVALIYGRRRNTPRLDRRPTVLPQT